MPAFFLWLLLVLWGGLSLAGACVVWRGTRSAWPRRDEGAARNSLHHAPVPAQRWQAEPEASRRHGRR